MPWVRLHGIKGYFDMIDLLEEYPAMRVTFNLVPSVLVQLMDYCIPETLDPFLELTLTPPSDLTLEQKQELLSNFFMAHWNNMIKPYPRYWELLNKRGHKAESEYLREAAKNFTTRDFQDLQALANLAWFGYRAKKKFPEINELIQKGKEYTSKEIERIIEIEREVIQLVIPSYQKAFQENRVELTTSAFYHPILPLVYDTDLAKRCMNWAPLPKRYHHPEDAEAQIQKAVDFFKGVFGVKPIGLWPSEGSVAPEIIPLLAKAGIQWIATDEDILMHSTQVTDKGTALFKVYQAQNEQNSVDMVFRDRGLSDLIGFTYSQNPPEKSVQDFLEHLQNIRQYNANEEALVSIILDGENAWEHYPDGGEGLLRGIYHELSQNAELVPTTFSNYFKMNPKREILPSLHSGSWIHHDFDIWIGSEEENTAWEYLGKTRDFIQKNAKDIPDEQMKKIMEQIYIAEGSDWFWWYGDDFTTEFDEEFDQLFRLHLSSCYKLMNVNVPEYLNQPVLGIKTPVLAQQPIGFIHPEIDGKSTHFYEWHEAGLYLAGTDVAMHQTEKYILKIFFGFDLAQLYIRIDPHKISKLRSLDSIHMHIYLTKPNEYKIVIPRVFKAGRKKKFTLFSSEEGIHYSEVKEYTTTAFEDTLELAIPFSDLHLKSTDEVRFRVSILKDEIIQETHPKFGYLNFTVPNKDFEMEMWSV